MSTPAAVPAERGGHRRAWLAAGTLIGLAAVLAALLVTGVLPWPFAAKTAVAAEAATQTVTTAPYRVTIAGPGTLEAARTLAVTNATAGTIAELASVGQRVSKGDILARLDPTPFQRTLRDANLALQKAQAQQAALTATQSDTAASLAKQIADARANVATQERAVQRAGETVALQERLLALGAVSASDVQSARDTRTDAGSALTDAERALSTLQTSQQLQRASAAENLKNAELAVQQQIAVEQAQEDLDSITTIAPFDGVVSSVATEVGAYVPEDGTVLTLIDDRTLDLPAQIDETEISKVNVGQTASVTLDAMPGQTFEGSVTAIAPTGAAVSNIPIFEVTVSLENDALTLRPGMTAEADIAVRTVANAATLPLSALQEQTGGAADGRLVMVRQPDGTFAPHVVQLVDSSGYNAVVAGDLNSGDVVLLSSAATTAGTNNAAPGTTRTGTSGGIPGLGGGPGMGGGMGGGAGMGGGMP